jgi:hypothetical protein
VKIPRFKNIINIEFPPFSLCLFKNAASVAVRAFVRSGRGRRAERQKDVERE